jgi:hypothetical protein
MPGDLLKERLLSIPPKSEAESHSELPDTSAPYQAHGRAANKPVYTLHCCLGKNGYRSFQYMHLDSDSTFSIDHKGHVISMRFVGTKIVQVTIRGRNLWRLYDYLHQHRLPWVMLADRDFADGADKQVVITTIEIEEVKERLGME